MLRSLVVFAAVCILLLVGFITMEKKAPVTTQTVIEKTKELLSPKSEAGTGVIPGAESDTRELNETAKPVIEGAVSAFDDRERQSSEDSIDDVNTETEIIRAPYYKPVLQDNTAVKEDEGDKWAVLNETHSVLSDVGDMLK